MVAWSVIALLCAFVWATLRTAERDVTFFNFLRFIGEFIAMPVIVVWEQYKK